MKALVLTGRDRKVFLTAMLVNCGTTIAMAIGSRILVKRYDQMRDVGQELGKIATYQNALLHKHLVELDEFDLVVFNDMIEDLNKSLKRVGYPPLEAKEIEEGE